MTWLLPEQSKVSQQPHGLCVMPTEIMGQVPQIPWQIERGYCLGLWKSLWDARKDLLGTVQNSWWHIWRGEPKVGKEKRSQWFVEGQTWGKKDRRDQSSVSELLVRVHVQPYPVPDYHGLSCIVINSISNYFPRWGDSLFCIYVFATPDIMLLLFRASGKRQKKNKMLDSAIRKFSRERCWRSISLPVRPSVESQIIVFILGVVDYR